MMKELYVIENHLRGVARELEMGFLQAKSMGMKQCTKIFGDIPDTLYYCM
jgi:hypothetical protein